MILYILVMGFTYLLLWLSPEDEKIDTKPFSPWIGYLLLSVVWPITLAAYIIGSVIDCNK